MKVRTCRTGSSGSGRRPSTGSPSSSTRSRREVRFQPSYDHRDEHDGRGCGSVIISFNLTGPLGAISAEINTGWMARPYLGTTWPINITAGPLEPRGTKPGVDLLTGHKSLHSGAVHSHCTERRRDWWYGPNDGCTLVDGPCYGDTGYLVGDQFLEALVSGGDEAAWKWLEETYIEWLGAEQTEDGGA